MANQDTTEKDFKETPSRGTIGLLTWNLIWIFVGIGISISINNLSIYFKAGIALAYLSLYLLITKKLKVKQ